MAVEGDQSSVLKNSKNTKPEQEHEFLGRKRERVEEEMPTGGAYGPQEGGWRGQELGGATWPSGLLVAPPGHPQEPPDGFLPGNFEYNFFGIFWETSLWRIFQSSKSCKNFRELETKVRTSEVLNTTTWVKQGE